MKNIDGFEEVWALDSVLECSRRPEVKLPRLYALADGEVLRVRGLALRDFAQELRAAGVELVQWRAKALAPQEVLAGAEVLKEVFAGSGCRLIMNDRADLAVLAGFDGVHVGQGDLRVEDARRVLGVGFENEHRGHGGGTEETQRRWVGVSTHTEEQVREADGTDADYVAVGPVFATGTKADAEPVIGLEGVRRARALTEKRLVAIGGITPGNAAGVLAAGADAVAVISGLFVEGRTVEAVAREFLALSDYGPSA